MRVSRATLASHRQAILAAAGQMFRARGIEAVSVAEVMQSAGLTHGGFYGHYRSKSDLAAAACRGVLAEGVERWRERAATSADPVRTIVSAYLSPSVLEQPERACPIPSLGIEVARAGGAPAMAMSEGIDALLALLTEFCRRPEPEREAAAMAAFSTMIGGVVLARSCTDPVRAQAVLQAARETAIETLKPAG